MKIRFAFVVLAALVMSFAALAGPPATVEQRMDVTPLDYLSTVVANEVPVAVTVASPVRGDLSVVLSPDEGEDILLMQGPVELAEGTSIIKVPIAGTLLTALPLGSEVSIQAMLMLSSGEVLTSEVVETVTNAPEVPQASTWSVSLSAKPALVYSYATTNLNATIVNPKTKVKNVIVKAKFYSPVKKKPVVKYQYNLSLPPGAAQYTISIPSNTTAQAKAKLAKSVKIVLVLNGNAVCSDTALTDWDLTATSGASPSQGAAPLDVNFDSSVTGGVPPYTYHWVFGDGGTATAKTAYNTYASAGSYQPSLTISDSIGGTLLAVPPQVKVFGGLSVTANATPTSGVSPLVVGFAGSASGGIPPYAYTWDFGDGSQQQHTSTAHHTYNVGGSQTATFIVTDSANPPQTASTRLSVLVTHGITVGVTAVAGSLPRSVQFNAAVNGGVAPYNYAWDFGDGSQTSAEARPLHVYAAPGNYQVTVQVGDSLQGVGVGTATVVLTGSSGNFTFTATASSTSGPAPLVVPFSANVSGGTPPYSFAWTFGDGEHSSSQAPIHTYNFPGVYSAQVVVSDSSSPPATAMAPLTITVNPGALTVTPSAYPNSGTAPLNVAFSAATTGGVAPYSYTWNFGDGTSIGIGNTVTHTYSFPGTFTAIVSVADSQSPPNSASAAVTIPVTPGSLAASLAANPASGNIPLATLLSGNAYGGVPPYSYSLDFGDASEPVPAPVVSHSYSMVGTFTPTLNVFDSAVPPSHATATATVTAVSATLALSIDANPRSGTGPLPVAFVAQASGGTPPYDYSWAFGDGDTGTSQFMTHTYNNPGVYTVTAMVKDFNNNTATATLDTQVTVVAGTLRASATANPTSGSAPLAVAFSGSASGGTPPYSYAWLFGDDTGSAGQVTSKTYTLPGHYYAVLTVTDSASSAATASANVEITVSSIPLTVAATANPTTGVAPLAVAFNATANGGVGPYTYTWAFGDGSSGAGSTASHVYSTPGTYTAMVTVVDSKGATANATLDTQIIVETGDFRAYVTATPTSGSAPLAVAFTGTATGGIPPYSYYWNFGDGSPAGTGSTVAHVFNAAGTFPVVLTVHDSAGTPATASANVNIIVNSSGLTASIIASPTSGPAPLAVGFSGNASGGVPPYVYDWNFGDGAMGTGQVTGHSYVAAGSFPVVLTVHDSAGTPATATAHINITVTASTLSATATASPTSGTAPLAVAFSCIASGGTPPYSYNWNFGDATNGVGATTAHTYVAPGNYNVTVTVKDSAGTPATVTVSVAATIVVDTGSLRATATANPTSGTAPLAVAFNGSASGGVAPYSYSWNFGDGTPVVSGGTVSHTYNAGGNYTAILTVVDSAGTPATASASASITVTTSALSASATAAPTSGAAPLAVAFSGSASGGTPPYTFSWNFADGSPAGSGATVSHTYNVGGSYNVVLSVTDSAGTPATATTNVSITVSAAPLSASATASPTSGTVPLAVAFSCTAAGGTPPYTYSWTFGDGNTGSGATTAHTYTTAGTFTPSVTVRDSAGTPATITITLATSITTTTGSLRATATANPTSGTAPLAVAFNGSASGGVPPYSYDWNFGDGSPNASGATVSHTYGSGGNYTAVLTVTDSAGTPATASVSANITVTSASLSATANANPLSGNTPLAVAFSGSASGGVAPYSYSWAFGDGSGGSSATMVHTYTTAGSYTATLTVSDSQVPARTATASVTINVNLTALTCSVTANPTSGPAPLAVAFGGAASGGVAPYTYSWNFGDGGTGIGPTLAHTFTAGGNYNIVLTVTDSAGTPATATANVSISVSTPVLSAAAYASPTSGTAPLAVGFTGSASGGVPPYTFSWVFGDGGTGTGPTTSHSYTLGGNYGVVLTVRDSAGTPATATANVTINVVNAALSASAVANPTSGLSPLAVAFTGSAAGGVPPYTYSWVFGDGGTGSGTTVSHTYISGGSYSAVLTVRDSAGTPATATANALISVSTPGLTATATANPTSGTSPLAVAFTGGASGGIPPYSFSWTFGDGGTGTGSTASHTYSLGGNYTAVLTVTDSAGTPATAVANATITVVNAPLSCTITAIPTSGTAPLAVAFNGGASGGVPPYTYAWAFGDGTTGSGTTASHTYTSGGNYTAILTVQDSAGTPATATSNQIISVSTPGLSVTAVANPTSGVAPLAVALSGAGSGGVPPYTYAWTFGDGGSGTGATVSHTYLLGGSYTATLTLHDSASGTATATASVSVTTAPLTCAITSIPTTGVAPLPVAFSGGASGGVAPYNYTWAYGDGGTGTGTTTNHTYTLGGTYTAVLTVKDSNTPQATATANSVITVTTPALSATATATPTSGVAPLPVAFTGAGAGGVAPYTYTWTFGDGGTGTGSTASHTYNLGGTYTATVTVKDSNTPQATATASATITVSTPGLSASVTANPTSGVAPLPVAFTGSASGGVAPYTYTWAFGDGGTGAGATASHTYNLGGTYTATLTVKDSNTPQGTATGTATITVTTPTLSATATASPTSGTAPLAVAFTGSATGGVAPYTYSWAFGDGGTGAGATASHTYTVGGNYSAVLTVNDSASHTATASATVTVTNATLTTTATVTPTSGTAPLAVAFSATASGGVAPYTYSWSFGDGNTAPGATASHTYNTPGTYTVTLTARDSNTPQSTATDTKTVSVTAGSLLASIVANPTTGTAPLGVLFTGSASGGVSPYHYAWVFGDGNVDNTDSNITGNTYVNPGSYTCTLTVTDSQTPAATATKTQVITVNPATLTVTAGALVTTGPAPFTASFSSAAMGGVSPYTYSWAFGDGGTGTGSTPSHTYSTKGTYNAVVTVTDSQTPAKTATATVVITVTAPLLSVTASGTPNSGTVPLTVAFTSNASGGTTPYTYTWNFGDSTAGSGANVSHTYNTAGTFTAIVTVTDSSTPVQTATANVSITTTIPPFSATINASTTSGQAPLLVNFTTSIVGGVMPYKNYSWNFGDGGSASGVSSVSHTFVTYGTFTVTFTCNDSNTPMGTATATKTITVTPTTITGSVAIDCASLSCGATTYGPPPVTIPFAVTVSGGAPPYTNYNWRFGDGTPSVNTSVNTVSHTYTSAGTFAVSCVVTDSLGTVSSQLNFNYFNSNCYRPPVMFTSNITITPNGLASTVTPSSGSLPMNVNLNASIIGGFTGPGTIKWYCDDPYLVSTPGQIATGGSTTFTFSNPQTTPTYPYTGYIYAHAYDATSTFIAMTCKIPITITGAGLSVNASASITGGSAPLTVNFSATVTGGTPPYTYSWAFGDGQTSALQNPTHTYVAVGSYNCIVTVTDAQGHIAASTTIPINVTP